MEMFPGLIDKSKKKIKSESKMPKMKQRFKPYGPEQRELLLEDINDLLPKEHFARFLQKVVLKIDHSKLREKYKGGGASAYDPVMLLLVWLLGYYYHIYTCRPLSKQLRENIAFMWISGKQHPDFRTLNNFRVLLGEEIKQVFKQTLQCAMTLGLIDGRRGFIDGTIIQADANKHKVVWKKQVKNGLERTENEINELVNEVERYALEEQEKEDNSHREDDDGDDGKLKRKVSMEEILETAEAIERELKGKQKTEQEQERYDKSKRLNELRKREEKYKEKEKRLAGKNSYSPTDPDAPGVMDKEGCIRPGYTEVIITQNQIVLDYETANIGERRLLKQAIEGSEENTGTELKQLVGDGNFGDESNYTYLEGKEIEGYVKHNRYHKEKSKKWHREKIRLSAFRRQQVPDILICPNGKQLELSETVIKTLSDGYEKKVKKYQACESDCGCCPLKGYCTEAAFRTVELSERYEKQREEADRRCKSEEGKKLLKQRGFQVETVFGERKRNFCNKRFSLRGLKKVKIESGLFYSIYNLKKIYNNIIKNMIEINEEILNKSGIKPIQLLQ